MTRLKLVPNALHPITIQPTAGRVIVRVGAEILADSARALTLKEASYQAVHYIPMEHVNQAMLKKSDTATYCPFKGDCTYYTVVTAQGDVPDAVWTYERPYSAVAEIAGHIACYPSKVDITIRDHAAAND